MLEPAMRLFPKMRALVLSRGGGRWQSDHYHRAEIPQEGQLIVEVVRRAHRVHNQVELALNHFQRSRLLCSYEMLRAKPRGVLFLIGRGAEHSDVRAHRRGELHSHMSEPAQADDGDMFSWLAPELV